MKKRVVITGVGVVSSLGNDKASFWKSLVEGQSGLSDVSAFDTKDFHRTVGGQITHFNPSRYLSRGESKVFGRATQFAIHAASQALEDSGLDMLSDEVRTRTGVVVGTTFGEAQIIEKATIQYLQSGDRGIRYENLVQYNPNALSINIAKKFNFCGPNVVVPTACSAGNYAIIYASWLIQNNLADTIIAGGSDPFSHVSFSGFSRLGVMADRRCQPFDRNRKGLIVGEGSGIMVVEDYQQARSRGAKIYAEILGGGLSCDANHMTIPEVNGAILVMKNALEDAKLSVKDVDYICAHGTGTILNDKTESSAIRQLFYESGNCVPVSSIKSMLGHTMGAASALEAIACSLMMQNSKILPTINYESFDPECDIDCVPNTSRQKVINVILNNSFAFGGNNACIVLGRS